MKYCGVIFLLMLMIISSCKKDSVIDVPPPYFGYVPADTGRWIIYDVDSTFYDDFPNPSVIHHYEFQVIERIHSTFIDGQGRLTHRLERMKRDSTTAAWQLPRKIWTSNLSYTSYEKVEDNYRYVKLGFPISATQTWNGNAFNSLGYMEYYYDAIHQPLTIATIGFDSTITVLQGLTGIVTEDKNGTEIYANHVGLVYKLFNDLRYDLTNPQHAGGVTYTYTIRSYGTHNAPMPIEN